MEASPAPAAAKLTVTYSNWDGGPNNATTYTIKTWKVENITVENGETIAWYLDGTNGPYGVTLGRNAFVS